MRKITYKLNEKVDPVELSAVFRQSGIKRPFDDIERLKSMIHHSDLFITAWDNQTLIGVARAITDFSYCCYLSDLAVKQNYQNIGVGTELVRLVHEQITDEVALILLSAPNAMEYYPRIGFERIQNGFIIPRKQ
ncbi:GNAT family N-acetyltransferase [Halalkalibacter wakoensis]